MAEGAATHRRGPWAPEEDKELKLLVRTIPSSKSNRWVRIACAHGSRTPKQCRERYHQKLKPSLNHDPITPEEGA